MALPATTEKEIQDNRVSELVFPKKESFTYIERLPSLLEMQGAWCVRQSTVADSKLPQTPCNTADPVKSASTKVFKS